MVFILALNPVFASFDDIQNNELSTTVIEFLREHGIGESSANFYPRRPISLAEFLVMGFAAVGVAAGLAFLVGLAVNRK